MRTPLRALVAVACLPLVACADDGAPDPDGPALVSAGTLTVCSDAPVEPFVSQDPDARSGYSGFDIDLMEAFADRLGLDLSVRAVPFESIVSGAALTDGGCDVAASAITIRDDWAERVAFSEPYYRLQHSLLVAVESGIRDVTGTAGHRIGVQVGTSGADHAEGHLPEDARIVGFATTGDMIAAFDAGSIEGMVQDLAVNAEWVRSDEGVEVVDTFEIGEQYGFGTDPGREDGLLEALNHHLLAMRADGTYDQLYEQYFGTG